MSDDARPIFTPAVADRSRPVKLSEVAACAKRGCSTCDGKGLVAVRRTPLAPPQWRECGCALRRFSRENAGRVVKVDGNIFWAAEERAA